MDTSPIICTSHPPRRRQLRVAMVTETYPPEINGVAMTIGRLVQALQARGHHIQLVRPRQTAGDSAQVSELYEEILRPGLPLPRYNGLKFGLPARRALALQWKLQRPDLVYIITEGPLGWSALSAARKLRLPIATNFHTNFHRYSSHYGLGWLQTPILAYLRRFHNAADATLVPTRQMVGELDKLGYRNLAVLARGVDTQLYNPVRRDLQLRAQWGVSGQQRVVMIVSRLAAEKNLHVALATFARMRQIDPQLKLVVVGDGPERAALEAQAEGAIFCGMQTGENLARHYASGDIFLFPSLTETWGNVTTEALASGLAVVAFDYAAGREHIQHGVHGLLATMDEQQSFIEQGERLAREPALAHTLGIQARQLALNLDWESVFDTLEQHLLGLVHRWEASHVTTAAYA